MNNVELIAGAKESALSGEILDRERIISLLSIDPHSEDCRTLGAKAREAASAICKDKAYLWAAIGLDCRPCPMSCSHCSLGEAWGIVQEESELSDAEVIELIKLFVSEGARWTVLRTTQLYDLDRLVELAKRIRKAVPGKYQLSANVGGFDEKTARKLADAGLEFVYHALRLREGINTKFNPEDRRATLEAIMNSPLKLASMVEPIGIEHGNEEIADSLLNTLKYRAVLSGAMKRIAVKGTPFGELPEISTERLAQIVAVTRLAAGFNAPDICVHPASRLAIDWGANVAVIETGAIPRDDCCNAKGEWSGFSPAVAKEWFNSNGYQVGPNW